MSGMKAQRDEKGPPGLRKEPTSFQKGKLATFKGLEMRKALGFSTAPGFFYLTLVEQDLTFSEESFPTQKLLNPGKFSVQCGGGSFSPDHHLL